MRVAAIDVGTNSVHLYVADVGPQGQITVVARERTQVELGRGGLRSQELTEAAIQRGVDALMEFKRTIDSLHVEAVTAAATSAVREAKNGRDFTRAVRDATGIHVRTISGLDEARLIYQGVRPELDFSKGYNLLLDLGGGSVELTLCDANGILASHSAPLGHIRMTESYVRSDPPTREELSAVRAHAADTLRPTLHEIRPGVAANLVGTGGSIRTLAKMATLSRGEPEPQQDNGLVLYRDDLDELLSKFVEIKQGRLGDLPGMDGRRRATLPAAAAVVRQAMKTLDFRELVTSDRSLRDGLLADWIIHSEPELALARTVPWPRMRTVLRMMDRYEADQAHSTKVRDLALALFDGLAGLDLDSPDRQCLEYSALLHDIGYHIDARDHHKHGQYLILNSRMPGFTAPEVALIANIVRYHRRRPKRSHFHFRALPRAGQRKVEILSAILRVADALDHSHNQPVTELRVEDSGGHVTIRAQTRAEAHIERWAAERRQQRLSNVLDRPVTVLLEPQRTP